MIIYRQAVKRAISLVAAANLAIQILIVLSSFEPIAALACLPQLPEPFFTFIELGKSEYGRIILSAGFAMLSCGLRLLLNPIQAARETGVALILLVIAVAFLIVPQPQAKRRPASCEPIASNQALRVSLPRDDLR